MHLITITLHDTPFNPWTELAQWEQQLSEAGGEHPPATACFVGRVRGRDSSNAALEGLELEHYPGMTEAQIRHFATTALSQHQGLAARVAHRVGRVGLGEALVLVAVTADRRGQAQRACTQLLEALKHNAPLWKKELQSDGSGRWVQGNTPL